MIRAAKKIPILRYFVIIFLISLCLFCALYLDYHYSRTQRIRDNIDSLIMARDNAALIDSCIINLYSADNNSRLYALTGEKRYIREFYREIRYVSATFTKIKLDNKGIDELSHTDMKQLIHEKSEKTNDYIRLRNVTDSLIRSSLKIDTLVNPVPIAKVMPIALPVTQKVKTVTKVDTIKPAPVVPQKRKKLFARIIEAFSSKNSDGNAVLTQQPVVVKNNTVTQTTTTVTPAVKVIPKVKVKTQLLYKGSGKLYTVNNKLKDKERDILLINSDLINQMIGLLNRYKQTEQSYASNGKLQLQGDVRNVFSEFKQVSTLVVLILVILVVIIFFNIYKIFRMQKDIIRYSEDTEMYALSKSKFLANMSHEIRTPLNSVIGFSEQLSKSHLSAGQKEQVDAIGTSSKMLLDVVNEILDFSKYETGKISFEHTPFMPYNAIREIFDSIRVQTDKKEIHLKNEMFFDTDICFAGDQLRLKQVIMNLMSNAIKFTHHGEVSVRSYVIKSSATKYLLKVQVSDTGIGISKEHQKLIFDEFAQIASAQSTTRHQGTGLGLAICKKIVQLQGGRISVTSVLGKGSIFKFELPFDVTDGKDCITVPVVNEIDHAGKVSGKYALVAEDNKLNVLLVSTILKKWKIKFDVAYDGKQALDLYNQNQYDLILTDIEMPEMGGMELSSIIRTNSDIPILALTGNVMKEDRDKYKSVGINDVILKPFLEKDLIGKIAEVVGQDMVSKI